ncbi:SOS response-associated peptidase [Parabacteroides goldsteinii]|uniref:Abasic site processing protein n=1 Tax=Parabacteroides goldsteinii TaxID=328812 RepID=A0A0J6CKF3_9BACT|nr:SOS response-associated peptidase [Parabacteroides goldsteinii]KMM33608.1 hypothetical protein ACM15_11375 [Parabacteroides goldsteinii]
MCFYNSMSAKATKLAARYGRNLSVVEIAEKILKEQEQYRVNAFSFPEYPIITSDPEIQSYKWGLIPFWTKDEKQANEIKRMTLNARADTIFQKPSFREPIMKKRCIVPSTGYFEWRHEDGKKIPYYIYVKDEPIFSMAGVYDSWLDRSTGEVISTFSIITTEANELTGYIHNTKHRMPAILNQEDEEKWLDPKLEKSDIEQLLLPFPADQMDAYVINNDFLKKKADDPMILNKVS